MLSEDPAAADSATSAAARLCGECGLCCNGVMFHTVRLQPGDSPADLAALGLKLKRKKGANYILQPCPAFRGSHCSIYASRPERCRLFECRQFRRVAAGEITHAAAMTMIRDVQARVVELNELLETAGGTNAKRPLAKRCEKALAEPASDDATAQIQNSIQSAMREIDALLDREFRLTPKILPVAK